ncbi:MAG: serine protease [Meiothermus sp.]
MSLKTSAATFGVLSVIAGGVLWWGMTRSQTPAPAAPQTQVASLNEAQGFLQNEQNTVQVVQNSGDGVVFVSTRTVSRTSYQDVPDFLRPFFDQPRQQDGVGSGFVIDAEGHILTNYHVIEGANEITIKFHNDSKEYKAKVIGTAPPLDIALVRVEAPAVLLKPMKMGDSDSLKVGQKAIAMGNPFGLEFTVTEGIISAIRKNPGAVGGADGFVPNVIQTDAAINPGNSGGPLLNSKGEVIGINTAIYTSAGLVGGTPQSAGVGFAIPINVAKQYLPDLKAGKTLNAEALVASRPRLGVTIFPVQALTDSLRQRFNLPEYGLIVQSVEAKGPAAKAGLRAAQRKIFVQTPTGQGEEIGVDGDVLLEADGRTLGDIADLRLVLNGKKEGEAITLKVWRAGRTLEVKVAPQIVPLPGR